MNRRQVALLLAALPACCLDGAGQTDSNRADAAFTRFWEAPTPAGAEKLVGPPVESGIAFDDALSRLRKGRSYPARTGGVLKQSRKPDRGPEHFYALNAPAQRPDHALQR